MHIIVYRKRKHFPTRADIHKQQFVVEYAICSQVVEYLKWSKCSGNDANFSFFALKQLEIA